MRTSFGHLESAGFTLIESLVAITVLTVAIVAPMSLATQALASAHYAKDQITAFYLAQEAIEAVRSIRDAQILMIAQSATGGSIDIFGAIPITDSTDRTFRIDARLTDPASAIVKCSDDTGGVCTPLQIDTTQTLPIYGYASGWTNTNFIRTVKATFVGIGQDELRITVTVKWRSGAYLERSFSLSEDLYRWIQDGASQT